MIANLIDRGIKMGNSNSYFCLTMLTTLLSIGVAEVGATEEGTFSPPQEFKTFAAVSFKVNPIFRGFKMSDLGGKLVAEASGHGYSIGVEADRYENDEDGYLIYGSYSYAFEELITSVGVNSFDYSQIKPSTEIFLELTGREDYLNFTPSLYLAKEVGGLSRNYMELRVSKAHIVDGALLEPFIEFTMSDYFSNSFKYSHTRFGLDVVQPIGRFVDWSTHVSITLPDGVIDFSRDSSPIAQAGINLLIYF